MNFALQGLTQLYEHPTRRFWMEKRYQFVVGATFGFAVERDKALRFEAFYFRTYIVHFKSNVMDALAALFDEFGDGAFRVAGFQKFNLAFSNVEKRGGNALAFDSLHFVMGFTQEFAKEFVARRQIAHGDANVVYSDHGDW